MSELFDQAARSAPGTDEAHDRLVKWLVGDRLACVLLLEDSSLAFRLAEQGRLRNNGQLALSGRMQRFDDARARAAGVSAPDRGEPR